MGQFDDWNADDQEDEEFLDDSWSQGRKDAVLFAIDCSESMLKLRDDENGNSKSYLQVALEGCKTLQKRKARVAPNDLVGILVFNTAEKVDSEGGKSGEIKNYCHVVQPVQQINAPKIQELTELLDDIEQDPSKLRQVFVPKLGDRVPMGDVFTSCNWMLRDGAASTGAKRLFLITNEDDPHPGNAQLFKTAENTLFDLRQLGVQIQTFFISTHEKPFKIAKFYQKVLKDAAEQADMVDDVVTSFDNMLKEMRVRETPKRSLFSIPFHLAENFTIGVNGYGLVTEQKRPVYSYRSNIGREQEGVTSKTVYVDEELEMDVDRTKVVYGMALGLPTVEDEVNGDNLLHRTAKLGAKVFYTAEEVKRLRTMGMEPGLKLLGFKDMDQLHVEDNVKHSYFIFPNELAYIGSTRTFTALLRTMLDSNKMALVLGLFRRNSSPAFYAMIGQQEIIEGPDEQPGGFHLIQLPFADDIRAVPEDWTACKADENTIAAATAWIDRLQMKNGVYNPDEYVNPALKLHYAQLEALAFNEEFDRDNVEDSTAAPSEIIKKRAGKLIREWKQAVNEDPSANHYFVEDKPGKRKGGVEITDAAIRIKYDQGNLSKVTVDQMKEFLRGKGMSVSGKKAELMDRVSDWLDGHPE